MSTAIILCAGASTRFSAGMNKTLYEIAGKPVFLYSVEKFSKVVEKIVLVVRKEEEKSFSSHLKEFEGNVSLVYGGKRRQDSVLNALKILPFEEKVLIHDGARPMASLNLVKKVFEKISSGKCVIPIIPSEDALRMEKCGKLYSIDRKKVFRVQTPQGCLAGELMSLYLKLSDRLLYDDASAFEEMHGELTVIEGEKTNIKITTFDDVRLAEFFLSKT